MSYDILEELSVPESPLIPEAPPVPVQKNKSCKIVIVAGKINEGYCIVGSDIIQVDKDVYLLPGRIHIDRQSYQVFKDSDVKAFVAVPHRKYKGFDIHVLHPLKKEDFDRYENKQMLPSEVEIKYEERAGSSSGSYGDVELRKTEKIAIKKSKRKDGEPDVPTDMVKEIGIYRLLGINS